MDQPGTQAGEGGNERGELARGRREGEIDVMR